MTVLLLENINKSGIEARHDIFGDDSKIVVQFNTGDRYYSISIIFVYFRFDSQYDNTLYVLKTCVRCFGPINYCRFNENLIAVEFLGTKIHSPGKFYPIYNSTRRTETPRTSGVESIYSQFAKRIIHFKIEYREFVNFAQMCRPDD